MLRRQRSHCLWDVGDGAVRYEEKREEPRKDQIDVVWGGRRRQQCQFINKVSINMLKRSLQT